MRFANMQDAIRRRTITRTAVPDEELVVVMKFIDVDGHEWEYEQILEDADYDPSTNDLERSDDRSDPPQHFENARCCYKLNDFVQRCYRIEAQKELLDWTCRRQRP